MEFYSIIKKNETVILGQWTELETMLSELSQKGIQTLNPPLSKMKVAKELFRKMESNSSMEV